MAYTSHGHYIPDSNPRIGRPTTKVKNRCGGPGMCTQCSSEAAAFKLKDQFPVVMDQHVDHISLALKAVRESIEYYEGADAVPGVLGVVWLTKTLQNWKVIVAPLPPNGTLYEITFNGDSGETYVDSYSKTHNYCIPRATE